MKKIIIFIIAISTITVSMSASAGSDTECNVCQYKNCQKEIVACITDAPRPNSACMLILKCISNCDNESCVNACGNNKSAASVSKAIAVMVCSVNNCRSACAD